MKLQIDKVVYHIESQKDYNDLMQKLELLNCYWGTMDKPTSINIYTKFRRKTAIFLNNSEISYSNIEYAKHNKKKYPIIRYCDLKEN